MLITYILVLAVVNFSIFPATVFAINFNLHLKHFVSQLTRYHLQWSQQEEPDLPETLYPSVSQESNTDDVWDTLAVDQVEAVTSINLHDLCHGMSSYLSLVMILLENNTLESTALVDHLRQGELNFSIIEKDILKGMTLLQQYEQVKQSRDPVWWVPRWRHRQRWLLLTINVLLK